MFTVPTDPIDTPALLIDMTALEHNIKTMNDFLAGKSIKLRPHFKTIKIPEIAQMLIAAGAKGLTCAKLSEAEVLADAGIEDILIANEIVAPGKIDRLAALAGHIKHMAVAVESVQNVQQLSSACERAGTTLNILVELDVGMDRCGVRTYEQGYTVARAAHDAPNLIFEGIQAYEGHLVLNPEMQVRKDGVKELINKVGEFKAYLENHGIPVKEISGGGTGTFDLTGAGDLYTELQTGSYVYMDTKYDLLGLPFKHSMYLLSMVISRQAEFVILDAGLKSVAVDNGNPEVVGFENNKIKLSEEHFRIWDSEGKLDICDTVLIIPSHSCTNINLHDIAYGIRNGKIERIFEIKGRGKCQ